MESQILGLEQIISTCWDSYIKPLIEDACPQHLICIGMGVEHALQSRLALLTRNTGIATCAIPQPQAHLPAEEHFRNYQKYYEIYHDDGKGT